MFKNQARSTGSLLIEFMVALALSVSLLSVFIEIYLTGQKSLRLQQALHSIQSHAQKAVYILNDEIHRAGHIGCRRLTADFPIDSFHPDYMMTVYNQLSAERDHEMTVRHAGFPNVVLLQPNQGRTLIASNEAKFSSGDILIISDCTQAEIFQLHSVQAGKNRQIMTASMPLIKRFQAHAEIATLEINTFFIGKPRYNDSRGRSLFVRNIKQRKMELVSGIEAMRIFFVLSRDGKILKVPAQTVLDWSKVVGAAIDLELVSPPFHKTWHLFSVLR